MAVSAKKPILLGFRVSEESYKVFQVLGYTVRTDYTVDRDEDGRTTCTCSMFKYESRCAHVKLVTAEAEHWAHGKDDYRTSETIIPWQKDALKLRVGVFDQKADNLGVLSPTVGNLSSYNLVWLLTQPEPTESIEATEGVLNPHRIFKELLTSLSSRVSLNDDAVRRAGKDIPLPSGAEIIEGEDEFEPRDEDVGDSSKDDVTERVKESLKKKAEFSEDWFVAKRPHPSDFYVGKDDWQVMVHAACVGENLMLTGPTGSGKSEIVYRIGEVLKRPIIALNMGAMSEARLSLIGATHFDKEKGTWHQLSRFVQGVRGDLGPAIILLDEITRADRAASNILLPLLDEQRYLALDEAVDSPVIHRHDDVSFIATANIGMEYTGTDPIDIALKNRFGTILDVWFPPAENEVAIIQGRYKIKSANARRLVQIATKQRELTRNEGEFTEAISTRMLLNAARKVRDGFSTEVACKYAIENHYSAEGGDSSDRTKIRQIIQKGGH